MADKNEDHRKGMAEVEKHWGPEPKDYKPTSKENFQGRDVEKEER